MMSRSTYNLKIFTISTYDIPLDRTFLKLSNGIRHVMPSTDRRLELKEKTSMAQTVWQPAVYARGLNDSDFLAVLSLFLASFCSSNSQTSSRGSFGQTNGLPLSMNRLPVLIVFAACAALDHSPGNVCRHAKGRLSSCKWGVRSIAWLSDKLFCFHKFQCIDQTIPVESCYILPF